MLKTVTETAALLDRSERVHSFVIFIFMLGSAFLEVVGVGLIFPLVQVLVDPSTIYRSRWLAIAYRLSGVSGTRRFLVVCVIGFLAIVIFKSIYNALLTAYQEWLCHRISARLGRMLIARYLSEPWDVLLHRNSADMINVADIMSGWPLTNALRGYPIIATESLLTFGILCVLIFIAPYPALFSIVILGTILFLSHSAIRRHIVQLSKESAENGSDRLQFLQQSLASVKEIKVLDREAPFVDEYAEARNHDAGILTQLMIWQNIPRFLVEPLALAALTVAIIAVSYGPATNAAGTTAILGLFAVAGIRLTPSLTRILVASNSIRASSEPLERISQDLKDRDGGKISDAGMPPPILRREIRGSNIGYRYRTGTKPVLHDLSFVIARGEAVGLMGASGAGKTTLADIVIGLLQPNSGCILVDGVDIATDRKGWQRQIGYIPQTVSLIDASLKENIALGVKPDQIDMTRMRHVISVAQLDALVRKSPQALDTKIGERGARLSGGERQRIGIARALYDGRTVLVMDEATSALDSETENEIGEAIARLHGEFTILVIAHRVDTMRRCDRIMVLKDGKIIEQGAPGEIESRSAEFRLLLQRDGQ